MTILEIACFSPESAIIAGEAGADRIELCDNHELGGTTPPYEWLAFVKAKVAVPVFVMIRERGGNFQCSDSEFESMLADIERFKPTADGFVFGILDHDHKVDVEKTTRLVRQASPLPCTFHRAFDETPDPSEALEAAIATGCRAVLTSGGALTVDDGVDVLGAIIQQSQGRITIIPGGGVRLQNLSRIGAIGARTFHSSALVRGSLPDVIEIQQMKRLLDEQFGKKEAIVGKA